MAVRSRKQLMKLNILSDLHLSCGLLQIPQTDADVVILAGDIAKPQEAVAWAKGFGKPVLYVPGNHEFYCSSLRATVSQLKALCAMFGIPAFSYVFAGGLDLDPAKTEEILTEACEKARRLAEDF